jgi:hypothetical protein
MIGQGDDQQAPKSATHRKDNIATTSKLFGVCV